MYSLSLFVHSLLRWAVLAAGLMAVGRAIGGRSAGRGWTPADDSAGRWFVLSLDVQALIGIVIYVALSPFTMPAWSDMAETMRNAPLRFVVVEHGFGMILALALAHVGRVRVRKTAAAAAKHRTAAIFFGLALLVVFFSIPWPFTPAGRPFFRGL